MRQELRQKRTRAISKMKEQQKQLAELEEKIYHAGRKLKAVMDENSRFDEVRNGWMTSLTRIFGQLPKRQFLPGQFPPRHFPQGNSHPGHAVPTQGTTQGNS